jgi:hypothetical protein
MHAKAEWNVERLTDQLQHALQVLETCAEYDEQRNNESAGYWRKGEGKRAINGVALAIRYLKEREP